jgi:hypothetical protein
LFEFDEVQIRAAIESLRILKPDVFGASGHGFNLNPPLSEADVISFERHHAVSLPTDYRYFLTRIGNGGAGPYYGIFPLGHMDSSGNTLQTWKSGDGFVGVLSEPFPLRDAWNDLSGQPPNDLPETDEEQYWQKKEVFDGEYWDASRVNGAIPICHKGCALRVWLVVKGPESGRLWEDGRADCAGLYPLLLKDGSRASFSSWYCEWLDDVLLKASVLSIK